MTKNRARRPSRYRKRTKRAEKPLLTSRFFYIDDSETHQSMRSRRKEWK